MNAAEYVIMDGLGVAGPEKLAIVCGDEEAAESKGWLTGLIPERRRSGDLPIERTLPYSKEPTTQHKRCRPLAPQSTT